MVKSALFKTAIFVCCILSQKTIKGKKERKRILIEQSAYELVHKLSAQVAELTKRVNESEKEIKTLKEATSTLSTKQSSGSTYIRWGRTTCPSNGTHLVYAGTAGGQSGGSPDLCLPPNPDWGYYQNGLQNGSFLHGVEYEFDLHSGGAAFFGSNLNDQDAPCSVCATERSRVLMIPAKNRCSPGWTKEYDGYLVTSYFTAPNQHNYICLDRHPEEIPGGRYNRHAGSMYFVEAICEPLQCPPYVEGREITCVVCSQ